MSNLDPHVTRVSITPPPPRSRAQSLTPNQKQLEAAQEIAVLNVGIDLSGARKLSRSIVDNETGRRLASKAKRKPLGRQPHNLDSRREFKVRSLPYSLGESQNKRTALLN